jgi:hypothetical protein
VAGPISVAEETETSGNHPCQKTASSIAVHWWHCWTSAKNAISGVRETLSRQPLLWLACESVLFRSVISPATGARPRSRPILRRAHLRIAFDLNHPGASPCKIGFLLSKGKSR